MTLKSIRRSPTILQRLFNSSFEGKPVTPHTTRNWIHGNVLPTQDKLVILAKLLGTSSEYLRFGSENGKTFVIKNDDGTANELTDQQQHFVKRYLKLNLNQQLIISNLIDEMKLI